MGSTGGEGLPSSFLGPDFLEDEGDDIKVGEHYESEGAERNRCGDNVEEGHVEAGTTACQIQQWLDVTEEVTNVVVAAEAQLRGHD